MPDELTALRATWEYAYAMGHGCTIGPRYPILQAILDREQELLANQAKKALKLAHAVPDGTNIALCGKTPSNHPDTGHTTKCPGCLHEATRKNWTGR